MALSPAHHHAYWQAARSAAQAGNRVAERAALAAILATDRRDIAALLATGESFARDGDDRAATSWFTTAIAQARVTPPPPALHPLLDRAVQFCQAAQSRFGEHLTQAMAHADLDRDASPALRHAIDLLHGRTDLYLQQPTMFYYPGLPQRPFYEREEFAWVDAIEAQAPCLRDEYLGLIATNQPFAPYIRRGGKRPASSSPLLDDDAWGAAYLWQGGEQTALAGECPATIAALTLAPQPVIAGRSPMALYSRLTPGTHIAPHHGLLNTRLICHLPLVVPDGCGIRVGAETRHWRFGKMLIFDDSFEHEAWNSGAGDRTILLFEIWRPEIPAGDRVLLTTLFTAIDAADPARGQEQA